jgi:hypothetical protein
MTVRSKQDIRKKKGRAWNGAADFAVVKYFEPLI